MAVQPRWCKTIGGLCVQVSCRKYLVRGRCGPREVESFFVHLACCTCCGIVCKIFFVRGSDIFFLWTWQHDMVSARSALNTLVLSVEIWQYTRMARDLLQHVARDSFVQYWWSDHSRSKWHGLSSEFIHNYRGKAKAVVVDNIGVHSWK